MSETTLLTPPANGEPWPGQGGWYCCTAPAMQGLPARHLVFSEAQAEAMTYGPYGLDVPGAKSRVDGRANTAALLASGQDHPAAQWAAAYHADGHQDFHLPAQADLFLALIYAPQRFNREIFWSSTQDSRSCAFAQSFVIGDSYWLTKDYEFRVLALRWIPAL